MMLRQSLLYLPAQIIGPVMQLIAMVVWTHLVSEHTLGVITLVIATHELLQVAFLAWWSQFALRFFGRFSNADDAGRFYRTENVVLLSSTIVQSVAVIAILLVVVAPDATRTLIIATVAYVASRTLSLYVSERARVAQQIGLYSVQQIFGPTVGFLAGWILIELIAPAPDWVLAGFAIAQLLAVLLVLPFLNCSFSLRPFDRDIFRHALHYGMPLVIGGALSWIGLNAPRFIVNDLIGVAAAGLFAVGYGLGQRAAAVAAMLVTAAAYPLAVKRMEEDGSAAAMRQLADNGALLLAVLTPSVVGLFMLRHDITQLLIAEPFRATTLAILPLSVLAGGIRSARAHFCDQVFLLHSRTRLAMLVMAVDAAAAVGLGIVGTLLWGLVGAAAASVGAGTLAAMVSFAMGLMKFRLQIPWLHLLRIVLAAGAMAAALFLLPQARHIAVLLGYIAFGAAIYLAVLGVLYGPRLLRAISRRTNLSAAE
jgi:O-antigen/teichoic acid export membrane protein